MSSMQSKLFSLRIGLYVAVIVSLIACTPAATQQSQAIEPATPTPEIFNALAPSPTPPDSTLPLTCQVTDLGIYVNPERGYCFAYPGTFTRDESRTAEGVIAFHGPGLEDSTNPVRVSLEITTQAVPEESNLTRLVDAYLASFRELSGTIRREPGILGGEPAEVLEPVPGLLSSRMVMALHNETLLTLRFHPSDLEIAKPDLEALTQTVTGSFAFLPLRAQPASKYKTISWFEFGKTIYLSYDPTLAPWVDAWTVPAVPVSDQTLFSESHPTFAQIRFLGYQGGRVYHLPILPVENNVAQVMVFKTSEFQGFGDDQPNGFVNQLEALTDLLKTGADPAFCAQPLIGEAALPFLPWMNSKQSLCAQPKLIEFAGGRGIRFITYYTQGGGPALDPWVFYTFQGLTSDGQFYVSAVFPVETGIFPTEAPACTECGDPDYNPFPAWEAELTEQLAQLNALPEDQFAPSLAVLDDLVRTIQIGK